MHMHLGGLHEVIPARGTTTDASSLAATPMTALVMCAFHPDGVRATSLRMRFTIGLNSVIASGTGYV